MTLDSLRSYCLELTDVTEDLPFDEDTLAFRIGGKIFLLTSLSDPVTMNVKCDPERAIELRETWPEEVIPGYHMNKKHWNTVSLTGRLTDDCLKDQILHSYHLVKGPAKKKKP